MIGILSEKPSAKKNLAKALGGVKGSFNGEEYTIVSATGHLYQFVEPQNQVKTELKNKYSSWNISNLPWKYGDIKWKYTKSNKASPIIKEIKEILTKCDEIVIATDLDPSGEGDLIATEILINLNLHKNKKYSRMEFVDESIKSLQKAFISRKNIQNIETYPPYLKALFRSRWDFMSIQFTRIASSLAPIKGFIRQGRLKSTMVYLVGDALKELNEYKEIPYFQNRFVDENKIVYINNKAEKYDSEESVPNNFTDSNVIIKSRTRKETPPPKLMDLAKLSSLLASKGIQPKVVLDTYQKMYHDEILSYPRTTDKNITFEQFNEMSIYVDDIADLVGVDKSLLTHRTPRKTHVMDKGSHGANRPGKNVPKTLNDLEKYGNSAIAIYKILAKNFLAMYAENYIYDNEQGYLEKYPDYKGSINIPVSLGWRNFFVSDDLENNDSNTVGLGKKAKPFVYKGFPPKPPTPTMRWLMKQLENNNIGSGATRTSIYSEITNPKIKCPLLTDNKGKIGITNYGNISYQLLKGTKIGDVKTTEDVFATMEKIQNGNIDIDTELEKIKTLIEHDIKVMTDNSKKLTNNNNVDNVEKETFINSKGESKTFKTTWGNYKFNEDEIEKLKNGETIIIKDLTNKQGKKYSVKGKLAEQTFKGKKFFGFKIIEFI